MAEPVASLRALLSLDSAAFERGAKRAQASMSKLQVNMQRVSKSMKKIGRNMTLGLTAPIAAASAAMVATTSAAAFEIDNLAKVSNAGRVEFQKFAKGAKTVGIEQDKLADILKDVNDRVGDFVATGGGPMADFFENIAPKVGVTAAEFQKLSGPDALQLYVSSLEKAGVSQQEMTFYLEAMASDLTLLQPLLADGGKGLQEIGDQAERAGAIMSGQTIDALLRARGSLRAMNDSVTGLKNQMVAALAPALERAAELAAKAAEWFSKLSPEVKRVAVVVTALVAAMGPLMLGLGVIAAGFAALSAPIAGAVLGFGAIIATGTALTVFWGDIKAGLAGVVNSFRIFRADLSSAFLNAMASVIEAASNGMNKVAGLFTGAGAAASAAWGVAKDEIVSVLQSLPDEIYAIVSKIPDQIVQALNAGLAKIKAKAAEIGSAIKQGVLGNSGGSSGGRNNARGGASGGASGTWGSVGEQIGNDITDGAKGALGIQSPSKVFKIIGGDMSDGLEGGMGADTLGSKMGAAVSGAFSAEMSKVHTKAGLEAAKGMRAAADGYSEAARTLARESAGSFSEAQAAAEKVKETVKDVSGEVAGGGASSGNSLAATFKEAGASGVEAFGAIAETAKDAGKQVAQLSGLTSDFIQGFVKGDLSNIGSKIIGRGQTAISGLMEGALSIGGGGIAGIFGGLKSSVSGIGSALSGIAGSGIGGALSGIGGALTAAMPLVGLASTLISGFKKKTENLDQGLNVFVKGADTLAETFSTDKITRFWGLSKKTRTSTTDVSGGPVGDAVTAMQSAIADTAKVLDFGADAFKDFSYSFNVSLKGLSEDEKAAKVAEEIAKMGDAFAGMVPHISSANELLQVAQNRMSLQAQLLQAQGKEEALLAFQRKQQLATTNQLNQGLLRQVWAAQDAAKAEAERAQAAEIAERARQEADRARESAMQSATRSAESAGAAVIRQAQEVADQLRGAVSADKFARGMDFDFATARAATSAAGIIAKAQNYAAAQVATAGNITTAQRAAKFEEQLGATVSAASSDTGAASGLAGEIRALRAEVAKMRADNNEGNMYIAEQAQKTARASERSMIIAEQGA